MSKQRRQKVVDTNTTTEDSGSAGLASFADVTVPKVEQGGPAGRGLFVYVDISSVDNRLKRITEPKTLEVAMAPSRAKQRLQAGDVLVSMTRPNLNAVAMVPPELDGAVGSTGFHVLRANEETEPRWLYYAVQSRDFISAMSELVQGALYPAVRPKDILAFVIPHPPLDQQKRIVAEIEKQFSRLDEAVANLKRVKANLKRYKAAVLKAAVEGRLVATEAERARREGRSYETGAQLLQRILETRRSQWQGKGKYKEPAAPDTTDLPELLEGWVWASFEQMCEALSDEGKKIARSEYLLEGALPVIDQGEDEIGGHTDDADLVFSGALPVIAFGDHTRRFKLIHRPFVVGADGVKLIGIGAGWAPEFLWYQFQTLDFEDRGYSRHFQFVRNKPLRVPPLSEQHRIVTEVDRHLSLLRETEAQVDANHRRAERLRQSILAKAFSGQLIPEAPNAEPASALLTRMHVEVAQGEHAVATKTRPAKQFTKEATVTDLITALKNAGDWISAQEAFHLCGVGVGADTDAIERLYTELRGYIRRGIIVVERRGDEDWLRIAPSKGA